MKIGDSVKLIATKYADDTCNPIWGKKHKNVSGTITKIGRGSGLNISVLWKNGFSNAYEERDLELITNEWDE
jgi:hypothetical protein